MIDADCKICGCGLRIKLSSYGCDVFCEECENDPVLMNWYHEKKWGKVS